MQKSLNAFMGACLHNTHTTSRGGVRISHAPASKLPRDVVNDYRITPPTRRNICFPYPYRAMSQAGAMLALPNLKAALNAQPGLTQRGLARFMGVHESNISRLIQGKAKMLTREQIRLIEAYTGRSYEYLADLKSQNLSEQDVSDLKALRKAPVELVALLRKTLDPYR